MILQSAILATMALVLLSGAAVAQQRADPDFRPQVGAPGYMPNSGPRIGIDSAHKNWHTAAGRFAPFAHLLEADGYQVQAFTTAFTLSRLSEIDVLVVANAAADTLSTGSERLPTATAFTFGEVATIARWIADGGDAECPVCPQHNALAVGSVDQKEGHCILCARTNFQSL